MMIKVEAGLVSLKSKLSKPCRNLLHAFQFRLKKPFSIKSLCSRRPPRTSSRAESTKPPPRRRSPWSSWLRWVVGTKNNMKRVRDHDQEKLSLLIPPSSSSEEVEDACRSFENYLVEMIGEEGKVRDLMDVEELLFCWRNLKCPVYVDLVSRFYGELCKDLFSSNYTQLNFTPNLQLTPKTSSS